ncbi:putative thiol oxidase [Medicago truncatula]|uniref:Endoplasmic oxidoreductin protein n=1 Tax=Medicago truncatula TaxID=3880 RepID=G7IGL6_MEDTR|nr:thiol oxidase [Medicago truncatula]AES65781.1 endoplasmic oxidoreductin protein [Medicago truncatula]RHN73914.1 putative thiol oxidase [Medicago truncatula]
MVNSELKKKEKGFGGKWVWVVIPLIAAIVAISISSRTSSKISLFGVIGKACQCAMGTPKYSGMVEDCCCDYETVDNLNEEVLYPSLQELVKTPFFRYFKAKLWCDCPFWPDDGMCRLRDCSVCECPENEFPESFKKPKRLSLNDLVCQEGKPEAAVDRTLDSKAFTGWTEIDNPWTNDDETDNDELTYVNLQLNPERYTGYTGTSARRIWDAVYSENCPKYLSQESCQEEKILYKLISGLHSSISVHIASDYLLDEATNTWGQNLTLMYDRVLQYPDRVRNLYFTFLFVLRAVTKAADYLEQAEYNTGNPNEDLKTESLIKQLLYKPKLQAACPVPFDEAKLWKGQSGPELKQKIQHQFRNISALMDCVGCEKCRLWGKLQVLGLGTALKILFSDDGPENMVQTLQLQRNEVIALMNLLNRLSESVKFVHEMGPTAERITEGHLFGHTKLISSLRKIWSRILQT